MTITYRKLKRKDTPFVVSVHNPLTGAPERIGSFKTIDEAIDAEHQGMKKFCGQHWLPPRFHTTSDGKCWNYDFGWRRFASVVEAQDFYREQRRTKLCEKFR